jgi:hypothetical protein
VTVRDVETRRVFGDYFDALGIAWVSGGSTEWAAHPTHVVVSERAAAQLWGVGEAAGRQLTIDDEPTPRTVVGVVRDVRDFSPEAAPSVVIYTPYSERPGTAMTTFVRTSGAPGHVAGEIRRIVASLDPNVAVEDVMPVEAFTARALAPRRLLATVMGLFGIAALGFAVLGTYAVIAFAATLRRREFALRSTLGASPLRLLSAAAGTTGLVGLLGVGAGLLLSQVARPMLSTILYADTAADPAAGLPAVAVLIIAIAAAVIIPLRRPIWGRAVLPGEM